MRLRLFATLIVSLSAGCVASHDDVRGMYARQIRLESKVNDISRDLESIKSESQTVSSADTELVREQIALLEERLRKVEKFNSELKDKLEDLQPSSLSSQSLPQPEANPPQSDDGTEEETERASLPSDIPLYNEAYKNLGEGNYRKAREQFRQFLSQYPKSPQAPDALYWVAESYYREGKFEESILEFQRLIDRYPRDLKVPVSYLKQGLSLINIGREEEAKLFLQTLIDKYPKSQEARAAEEKLKELARKG